jgi:hypothetical protein
VRSLGSSRPLFPRHFWRSERVLPSAVPSGLAPTGSSSHKLPRLFRVLLFSNPSGTSQPRPPFHGVAYLLFATSTSSILAANLPRSVAFPSSAFLTPSTACAATGLVGLFHPTATSRIRPSGVFPRAQGHVSSTYLALSSLAQARYWQLPTSAAFLSPALRALPCESPLRSNCGVNHNSCPIPS